MSLCYFDLYKICDYTCRNYHINKHIKYSAYNLVDVPVDFYIRLVKFASWNTIQ